MYTKKEKLIFIYLKFERNVKMKQMYIIIG